MLIESSPTNLDPRVGVDAQSERIGNLIFDALLSRDESFHLRPWLAEHWEIPDPLTYVFHLRPDVHFHDGRPLTARDVQWTFDSLRGATGGKPLISTRSAAYQLIARIDTPDAYTVIFHLKVPDAPLLWNLSAIGIVPYGSGTELNRQPIGSGPFRFVSQEQDKEVVLARNDQYWAGPPHLRQVRFAVVPDNTTRALELRKGSADLAVNALTPDLVVAMRRDRGLQIEVSPGTTYAYLAMNLRDPILKDARVRQALAYAIDRPPIIHYLYRDMARPAAGILPPQHWAYHGSMPTYGHNPQRARQLLNEAGYPEHNGIRFHLTMKTSTEESTRLLAAVLQQQLREVGIALDIRSFEFATFFSDVGKGAFQFYSLRWIGGNQDPGIFEAVFHSANFPPRGFNRGYYSNSQVDARIDAARRTIDPEQRRQLYAQVQEILATDLPYINLWYLDNVLVHTTRVQDVKLGLAGDYDFLRTARIR